MSTTGPLPGWTPARVFLAFSAAYHLLLGVAGIAVDRTFPLSVASARAAESGYIFGVFETNGWHSVAALGLGIVSLWFVLRPRGARTAALALGISQAVVVLAFAVQDPAQFLFASNGADQVVHLLTAVGGVGAALATPARSAGVRTP